ncbi:MBOAT family O-acyltransferase [Marivirga sp.]|uniref:MBOAT family O-acyltransferase n=1 Tax=Marivirga sp. TaxID=2018662 RepID=UPI003DA70486
MIAFSSFADYFIGLAIHNSENQKVRKRFLLLSIFLNLGLLGFFKYFNFFIESFASAFSFFGTSPNISSLYIILPVGISFYTFQTLSYTIDIYRRHLEPTNKIIDFLAFVSFFPQLVAGPIERAKNLLPQFEKKRIFSYQQAKSGSLKIVWGLFKKVVIADNCAVYVNDIFNNHETLPGSVLFLGLAYFAIQIYCDFSGYSDIAIGTARLFGFNLMRNFAYPYFARDMAEHWRKWHISLSTWFKDYLYIPLGGSRGGKWMIIRNTIIIFTVSGFWHGADWTYIIWGFVNGLYFLPLILTGIHRNHMGPIAEGKIFPSFKVFLLIVSTFVLKTFTYVFFRAENIGQSWTYMKGMFDWSLFTIPDYSYLTHWGLIGLMLTLEWLQRDKECPLYLDHTPKWVRYSAYYATILAVIFLQSSEEIPFIYFQF